MTNDARNKAIHAKTGSKQLERWNNLSNRNKLTSGKYFSYGKQSLSKRPKGVDLAGTKRGTEKDVKKYYNI